MGKPNSKQTRRNIESYCAPLQENSLFTLCWLYFAFHAGPLNNKLCPCRLLGWGVGESVGRGESVGWGAGVGESVGQDDSVSQGASVGQRAGV